MYVPSFKKCNMHFTFTISYLHIAITFQIIVIRVKMMMVSFNSKSIFNGNRDYNNITVRPDKNAFIHLHRN